MAASKRVPVSVIIPAYNRADLVRRALASVQAQLAAPDEVLVVDDASSDDTAIVAADHGATVIRHEVNRGEGGARNTAIENARNEWVALLDSDDEWLPEHLQNLWPRRDGHALVAASALSVGRPDGPEWLLGHPADHPVVVRSPREIVFPDNPFPASGVMVRRDAAMAVGGFRRLPFAADLDMWLRVLENGTGLACPQVGYRYHIHEAQVSQDKSSMRAQLTHIIDDYRDEAWWSNRLVEQTKIVAAWDDLRAGETPSDCLRAAQAFAWVLASRRRIGDLRRLLAWRAALRKRRDAVVDSKQAA
jgi:glycosyltransferase involved in cell wall biosynthesis